MYIWEGGVSQSLDQWRSRALLNAHCGNHSAIYLSQALSLNPKSYTSLPVKTHWPRRVLNTQPSDLEPDMLPLRHEVLTPKCRILYSIPPSHTHQHCHWYMKWLLFTQLRHVSKWLKTTMQECSYVRLMITLMKKKKSHEHIADTTGH